MPVNGYTVGRDVVVDIIGPAGPLRFSVRTGFSAKANMKSQTVDRADGIIDHLEMPGGWTGTFDFERAGAQIDDYFAETEAAFYRGENLRNGSITETITEPDGSISQYRYQGVAMKYDDAGEKGGTATVKQKISWSASRRVKAI